MAKSILVTLVAAASVCSALPSQAKASKCSTTLANGNFENGQLLPWDFPNGVCTMASMASPGAKGSKYAGQLTIVPPEDESVYAKIGDVQQSFSWCVNTTYTIAFDYMTSGATPAPWVDLYAGVDDDYTRVFYDKGGATNPSDYKHASVSFTPKTNPQGRLWFMIYNYDHVNNANFMLDNVTVKPAKSS